MTESEEEPVGMTDEYIELYNRLAERMAVIIGDTNQSPFYEVVDKAAAVNPTIERLEREIKRYGDLRNIIIHGPKYPREVIAEPTVQTVARLSEIVQLVTAPKRLDTFCKQVQCFSIGDKLAEVLTYMHNHDFSQVVVRKDGVVSLLTSEGITNWLERQVEEDIISVVAARVQDALACEISNIFEVMGRNKTIDDARSAFVSAIERGCPRLFAIIITQNGIKTEKPMGIVTPWDLIEDSQT